MYTADKNFVGLTECFCYHSTVLPKMNTFQGLSWWLSPPLVIFQLKENTRAYFFSTYMHSIPFRLLKADFLKLILLNCGLVRVLAHMEQELETTGGAKFAIQDMTATAQILCSHIQVLKLANIWSYANKLYQRRDASKPVWCSETFLKTCWQNNFALEMCQMAIPNICNARHESL